MTETTQPSLRANLQVLTSHGANGASVGPQLFVLRVRPEPENLDGLLSLKSSGFSLDECIAGLDAALTEARRFRECLAAGQDPYSEVR
jgi:hypothetical protein